MSSFDYLHVPPPSWGWGSGTQMAMSVSMSMTMTEQVQDVTVPGARFVLGPAPPPRAVLRSKSKGKALGIGAGAGAMYGARMAFAASAPVKHVEGERRVKRARNARPADGRVPWAPQEGVVGIVAGGVPLGDDPPGATGAEGGSDSSESESDDPERLGGASGRAEGELPSRFPGRYSSRPSAGSECECGLSARMEGLVSSSSTTSSLVDLILEAIAAETDESFHYTTVSTSFSASSASSSASSSSSRSSTSSTISSRSGASWASDEDEEAGIAAKATADRDRDPDRGQRSFLMLEDESEEDFMDAVLSAYIRTDDEDSDSEVYSSNMSSGSNYGEFDEVELCDPDPVPCKAATNVKGILPPRKKFLSAVRVVHPGFAI